jgi:hypothetical protein
MMNGRIAQCDFLELIIVGMNRFDWQNFYVNKAWAWLLKLEHE